MDPVTIGLVGGAVGGALLRLGYKWVKSRAEVRKTELNERGLSERTRLLPPGSRLSERTAEREIEIVVGGKEMT